MTGWLRTHAKSALFAFILLTVAGVGAALRLPVSLFPRVDFPRILVSIDAGDRAGDQMVVQVTKPVEQALRAVPGVVQIRSTTSRGSADVSVGFDWGHDMTAAALQVQAALNSTAQDLPAGTRFEVKRMDPTVFPILGLALSSPSESPVALRRFAELKLRPLIASVPGVAAVELLGGRQAEYQVEVDPARLQALGLSVEDIAKAVAANNGITALGRFEDRHRLYLTLEDDRVSNAGDIGDIVVKAATAPGSGAVALKDVAAIHFGQAPDWTRITAQGRDAVLINVRQSPDAASVALVKEVRARLAAFKGQTPPDVQIVTYYDQTELVTEAAGSVRDAILLGAILAGVVLFVFLRSPRLMLITAILLPASLAAACLVLIGLKMSFNMMTLGGMAAAVGLVVDDAVVMLEHLMRRLQEARREGGQGAVLPAAAEMARPLIGSSSSTMVVFIPLAFLSGVAGGFFRALAITMTAALFMSLVFALFVAPLLASRWLKPEDVEAADRAGKFQARLTRRYEGLARRTLARPALSVLIAAGVLVALGALAYSRLGAGFMPHMDEGGFVLDYKASPGAALSETDRLLRQVEAIIRSTPDVDSYSRRTGAQLGGGLTEADEGDFFIHLKRSGRRSIETVMAEVRQRVEHDVPGLDIETAQLMEDLIGDLTEAPQPIVVKLYGSDVQALKDAAGAVAPAISKIPGVVEVVDGMRVAGDAVVIHVNRPAAALEGLDPDAVSRQLSALVGGDVTTEVQQGETMVGVRVRAPQDLRSRVESLTRLRLRAPDGHDLPLSRVASVQIEHGLQQITREDLQPYIGVTARLEGRDLGSGVAAVRKTVEGLVLPPGVRVEYGGLYAEQQRSFAGLAVVFVSAMFLVTLLLLFLFERWIIALSVLFVVAMAAAAVFIGLWATGTELNISALMGLTMVVGIIAELAVFYVAELDLEQPLSAEDLIAAGRARLRPILMSAIIAILALSPLAIGLGRGAAMQKPLAIAIICGLLAGAPMVLLLLPPAVSAMSGIGGRGGGRAASRGERA
jgi:CzcA family heavy metal efflux pump